MLNLLHLLLLIIAITGYYWLQPGSSESPPTLPAVETVNNALQDSIHKRPVAQTAAASATDQPPGDISDN
jgi:hypothetical protein